jgi:hypothetical protein
MAAAQRELFAAIGATPPTPAAVGLSDAQIAEEAAL